MGNQLGYGYQNTDKTSTITPLLTGAEYLTMKID
jgi:hypothetical protein